MRATRFLAQFELSKKSVASWPQWMRESAKMVAASLPESRDVGNKNMSVKICGLTAKQVIALCKAAQTLKPKTYDELTELPLSEEEFISALIDLIGDSCGDILEK